MIRALEAKDIDLFAAHLVRNLAESGRGGTPIFAPYPADESAHWNHEERRQKILGGWSIALSEPGWGRAWAIFEGDQIVGHIDLQAQKLKSSLHRAMIGMGIEASHRRQGFGKQLMETLIRWAREETELEWLDLSVFAKNEPARRLYRSCGFVEVGYLSDLFRVDGQKLDDVRMVLKLR